MTNMAAMTETQRLTLVLDRWISGVQLQAVQETGKEPGDPGYGITASGFPTVEGLTCAVDNDVIPRYADVFIQFADGTIGQYWATDTGVKGNHVDIYEPDYDTCIQNGRQILTVWWCKD